MFKYLTLSLLPLCGFLILAEYGNDLNSRLIIFSLTLIIYFIFLRMRMKELSKRLKDETLLVYGKKDRFNIRNGIILGLLIFYIVDLFDTSLDSNGFWTSMMILGLFLLNIPFYKRWVAAVYVDLKSNRINPNMIPLKNLEDIDQDLDYLFLIHHGKRARFNRKTLGDDEERFIEFVQSQISQNKIEKE